MENLDKMTLSELRELRKQIDKLIKTKQEEEKKKLISKFKGMSEDLGLSLEEVLGTKPKAKKRKFPPKYENPTTNEKWSGRGRKPKWVLKIEAEGKNLEDYHIEL